MASAADLDRTPKPRVGGVTVGQALGRRPLLSCCLLLAGVVAAIVVGQLRPTEPTASVQVSRDLQSDLDASTDAGSLHQQAELAGLPVVRAAAARAVLARHPEVDLTAQQLQERLTVTVPPGSSIVSLTFHTPTAEEAVTGADAAVREYVAVNSRRQVQRADAALRRYDDLERRVVLAGGRDEEQARAQIDVLRSAALLARSSPEALLGTVGPTEVSVSKAVSLALAAPAGLLAGFFPALVLGHRRESTHGRQRQREDGTLVLGCSSLGTVYGFRRWAVPVRDAARSRAAQEYRVVAAALMTRHDRYGPPVLAVLDAGRGGAASGTVLVNVALAAARSGAQVLVVGQRSDPVRVLLEDVAVAGASGGGRGEVGAVWTADPSTGWQQGRGYDLVLLNAPSSLEPGPGTTQALHAHAALVVVPHRSSTGRLQVLRERLEDVSLPCLGCVSVRAGRPRARRRRAAPLRPAVGLRAASR